MLVAWPLGGVDRVGVAPAKHRHRGHHAGERHVPLDRVVAPRLPGVDERGLAEPEWIARSEQEAMPAGERAEQRARPPLVGPALEEKPGAGGGERRLGDRRDPPSVASAERAPPAWARQVAGMGAGEAWG